MSGLDLYLSQSVFLTMLAVSAAAGIGLGLAYDCLVLLRHLLRPPKGRHSPSDARTAPSRAAVTPQIPAGQPDASRAVESGKTLPPSPGFWGDLLFSLVASVTAILITYYTNDGVLRAPMIVGLGVGFGAWYATLGRLLRRATVTVAHCLRRLVKRIIRLLLRPLARGLGLLGGLVGWTWRRTAGKWLSRRRERYTESALRRLTDEAKRGFDIGEEPPREGTPE